MTLILMITSILNLRLFSHYLTQAYLHARDKMPRNMYLRRKAGDRQLFDVKHDELFKLEITLYGLCDSDYYWNFTIKNHLTNDLGRARAVSDAAICLDSVELHYVTSLETMSTII